MAPELEAEVEEALAPVEEQEAAEPEVLERPRLRDRLAKARAAFIGRVHRRARRAASTPTPGTTWRRRCCGPTSGVDLTTELLDPLRAAVKAKQITEPDQLLDALKQEMKDRLGRCRP